MNVTLLNLPPLTLMELWGELIECLHGVNGYGGDTAEIYAYRFQMYSPVAHNKINTVAGPARLKEIAIESGELLAQLCGMFVVRHECAVLINGTPLDDWPFVYEFDHRVHVTIKANKETK